MVDIAADGMTGIGIAVAGMTDMDTSTDMGMGADAATVAMVGMINNN